jgi:hypothetical protein
MPYAKPDAEVQYEPLTYSREAMRAMDSAWLSFELNMVGRLIAMQHDMQDVALAAEKSTGLQLKPLINRLGEIITAMSEHEKQKQEWERERQAMR